MSEPVRHPWSLEVYFGWNGTEKVADVVALAACGEAFDDGCGCCLICYSMECDQATGRWIMYAPGNEEDLERVFLPLFAWMAPFDTAGFRARIEAWIQDQYDRQAEAILARIDECEQRDVQPGQVILLGIEGEVDEVWSVPTPLPDVLRRAIPVAASYSMAEAEPTSATWPRTADYRRVGEFTYQRQPL